MLSATLTSHCPLDSGLLPARPTHALRTCYVCLVFGFYPLNLERIAVACSSGFPFPASSGLLPARPTHALRTCYVCLLLDFLIFRVQRWNTLVSPTHRGITNPIRGGDTSTRSCTRGALRQRLLSAKYRVYCCYLQLWLPIAH